MSRRIGRGHPADERLGGYSLDGRGPAQVAVRGAVSSCAFTQNVEYLCDKGPSGWTVRRTHIVQFWVALGPLPGFLT